MAARHVIDAIARFGPPARTPESGRLRPGASAPAFVGGTDTQGGCGAGRARTQRPARAHPGTDTQGHGRGRPTGEAGKRAGAKQEQGAKRRMVERERKDSGRMVMKVMMDRVDGSLGRLVGRSGGCEIIRLSVWVCVGVRSPWDLLRLARRSVSLRDNVPSRSPGFGAAARRRDNLWSPCGERQVSVSALRRGVVTKSRANFSGRPPTRAGAGARARARGRGRKQRHTTGASASGLGRVCKVDGSEPPCRGG